MIIPVTSNETKYFEYFIEGNFKMITDFRLPEMLKVHTQSSQELLLIIQVIAIIYPEH